MRSILSPALGVAVAVLLAASGYAQRQDGSADVLLRLRR